MEKINFGSDGNSPVDMNYYGHALMTQRGGWTSGELGDRVYEERIGGVDTVFTKNDFQKALKKVSQRKSAQEQS